MSAKTLNSSRRKKEQRIDGDINDFRSHDGHGYDSGFNAKRWKPSRRPTSHEKVVTNGMQAAPQHTLTIERH